MSPLAGMIDDALGARDADALRQLQQALQTALDDWDRAYLDALCRYAGAWVEQPTEARVALLESGVARVDACLPLCSADSERCELLVLLAGITGLLVQLRPLRVLKWGRLHDGALRAAQRLHADNPRLWLLQGLVAFKPPSRLGGGVDAARIALERAERALSMQVAPRAVTGWGAAETHYWMARCHHQAGQAELALGALRRALARSPRHALAAPLLAELDRSRTSTPPSAHEHRSSQGSRACP